MNALVGWLRALAGKVVVPRLERQLKWFETQIARGRDLQHEVLFRKVRRLSGSQFGRDHGFDKIHTLADFRRQIPIADFDYYRPYIDKVLAGDVTAMFPAGERILMYTLSSGTTAAPKLIPINTTWMREYRTGWQIWGVKAFLDHPRLFYSKLAGVAGNWDMRRSPTDLPCGMASGLSARMQSFLLRMVYCIPPIVFEIDDPDAKYYTALRLAIVEPTAGFFTATPATVVNFAKLGDRFKDRLIRDIADGTFNPPGDFPERIRPQLASRLAVKHPARACELEEIVRRTGTLYPKDYWDMQLIACWLGGTVGGYARHIAEFYGPVARRDIGLLCSEGRFTIPMEDETPAGLLETTSHYYEFVPVGEIDSKQPTVLEAHELEVGRDYYILLTTSSGLFRYHICDVLRCVGFRGPTPILEFLNKGQRFSDMEGEKVSEHQLVEAVADASAKTGVAISAFTAVPVRGADDSMPPRYDFLFEAEDVPDRDAARALLAKVDDWLSEHNVMYRGKRADRYLGPPRAVVLPTGAWRRYDAEEIKRRGVGEDHYKHPSLVLDEAFAQRFPVVAEYALE